MRTTVRLDDALLDRARREAARRGTTLTALIEEGLRSVISPSAKRPARRRIDLPICSEGGGVMPGIDINNSADLLDRLEEDE